MTTKRINRLAQQTAEDQLSAGLTKHASTLPPITIAGKTISPADLIAMLQVLRTAASAADSTHAAWRAAVATNRTKRKQAATLLTGVNEWLHLAYGTSPDMLGDFGLTPRKKPVVSPEARLAGAAKARATRVARHTMGPKQKRNIKGNVAGVAIAASTVGPPVPGAMD
jgi:hypothetical protein